jgi:hypothetical protein
MLTKISTKQEEKISINRNQSLFFESPRPKTCTNLLELIKEQIELKIWLEKNVDAPKKEKLKKKWELKALNLKIEQLRILKHFKGNNPELDYGAKKLLYKEECYEY